MANHLIDELRAIARRGFPKDTAAWPPMSCPTCTRGTLTPIADSLKIEESETSKTCREDKNWIPDWIAGGFHCFLRCSNHSCNLVRVVGDYEVIERNGFFEGHHYYEYETRLHPNFFQPALPIIESRGAHPDKVKQRVEAAERVLWTDASSAANRLRSAIEALLGDQGIPRKGLRNNGKPYNLSLHGRIENLGKAKTQYARIAQLLIAVKWIGNEGSHEDAVRIAEVLDGAEILAYTLDLMYDDRSQTLERKAAEITARRGKRADGGPRSR